MFMSLLNPVTLVCMKENKRFVNNAHSKLVYIPMTQENVCVSLYALKISEFQTIVKERSLRNYQLS
jgi:hypothetical protein